MATTPFVLAGLAMVAVGFGMSAGDSTSAGGGFVLAIIGGLATLPVAFFLVQSVRIIRAPGRLRLTDQGFDVYKHSFAWTDVVDFHSMRTGGESPRSYVQVMWAPSAQEHPAVRRSARLQKLGQTTAPTYIGVDDFDTGGLPLQELLRRWKAGDRAAGRPVEPTPTPDSVSPEPETTIPLKRGDTIGGLVFTVPLFIGFAVAGPVLAILETEHHSVLGWIGAIAIWLICTGFFGGGVLYLLRELRKPGLILHANGFEYEQYKWAWADIEDIRPAQDGSDGNAKFGVRAVFRRDRPLPAAPSDLPFGAHGFATEGSPIDEVLRKWLQRYRANGPGAAWTSS